MIVLITILYIACVLVAFKVVKIKVNPVSVAAAVLIGVFLLGGVVIGWKMAAPMTGQMTVHRKVVPLLSNQDSKELIKKIHVMADQPVKKGDVLYETDSTPNQYKVDGLTAQLAVSRQNISELEAAIEVAAATVEKAQASEAFAKAQIDTSRAIQKENPGAVAKLTVKVQQETYEAAQAAVEQAQATRRQAESALITAKEAIKSTEAQLSTAKLNLQQCVVRAPADGHIMNWQAVEGTMTTTVISSAQGTFMDMTETVVAAVFPQNLLNNVQPGDTVEIAFKSLPGEIARGKVDQVLEYTGEGQLEPSGVLPVAKDVDSEGYLVVRITLDDAELAKELPLGGAGTTAIYTGAGKPFHIITKIALRMKGWLYYLPI